MLHLLSRRLAKALLLVLFLVPPLQAGESTVYRDQWGVPHIWGDSYGAVGYAVGQVQCEDSLAELIYCLYAGVGRLTETAGDGLLAADLDARRLRHAELAERAWPRLDPRLRELIEGYCAGINDYLEQNPNRLPVKVTAIKPVQVLAWHRSLLTRSSIAISQIDAEASRADGYKPVSAPGLRGKGKNAALIRQAPAIEPGQSNSWALAARRTKAGVPMLLIDPHWPSKGHLQLYEAWLHIPGEMHVGGFMIKGTPLPGLAVTPHAAWTVTAGGADSSDAYALRINPDDPHQYEFDGRWRQMEVRQEVFRIRQGDGFREETREVLATVHGPVFQTKDGTPYAASFGGFERCDALEQFFRMARATSTRQFKQALAMDRLSYFNVMWATAEGDIGFVQTGQVPLRSPDYNWGKMVPGWTSDALPTRLVPFRQIPAVINPSTGFLQNCNVAANVVTPGLTFGIADFPPGALYGHVGGYRARGMRATGLLGQLEQATLEDGRRVAFDSYVLPADLWVPLIMRGYDDYRAGTLKLELPEADRELLDQAAALLKDWDRFATRESTGATLFRFWRLACDLRPKSLIGRDRPSLVTPDTPAARRESLELLLEAAHRIEQMYGRLSVAWGDVKRLRRGSQEWPLSGDGLGKLGMDTLRATSGDNFNEQKKLISGGGQCVTSVVLLTDPPTVRSVVAYGQSNNPASPHFADQAPLYSEERFRAVPWTMQQLEPHVESTRQYQYPQ